MSRQESIFDQLFDSDEEKEIEKSGIGDNVEGSNSKENKHENSDEKGPEDEEKKDDDETRPLKKKRITYKEDNIIGDKGIEKLYHELPSHFKKLNPNHSEVFLKFIGDFEGFLI